MSDGTESKPQHGMMRVRSAAARAWYLSMRSRTQAVSPVMSTYAVPNRTHASTTGVP